MYIGEKMLKREIEGNVTTYYCSNCNVRLGEKYDVGGGMIIQDCPHYEWHEVSTTCFYNPIPGCGLKYISWLKQNFIVKINAGDNVYLLLPKS